MRFFCKYHPVIPYRTIILSLLSESKNFSFSTAIGTICHLILEHKIMSGNAGIWRFYSISLSLPAEKGSVLEICTFSLCQGPTSLGICRELIELIVDLSPILLVGTCALIKDQLTIMYDEQFSEFT